jgi:hypothetical protein
VKRFMVLFLSGWVGAIWLAGQTADEDLWLNERAFERAITTKQYDAVRPVFYADFLGVDAGG